MYLLLVIVPLLLSLYVSWRFKSKATKYSEMGLRNGLSGAEIARKMLQDHGIYDVQVVSVDGQLTDHYNPETKTVNLSQDVFHGRSVIAAAVAAHECGHAVQHADSYAWLNFRSSLVPVVSIASRWLQWVILGGILLLNVFPQLLLVGILLFAATTLFSFITLPVEFDASKRALAWLENKNVIQPDEHHLAKDALKWAANTYVSAAISSLATLAYYVMVYAGGRRNS